MIVRLLLILSLLTGAAGSARAQSGGDMASSIPLRVLGVYSLSADKAAYARFIRSTIDSRDSANFAEKTKDVLRRLGRGDSLQPFTDEDRQEWEERLRSNMDDAAVLEVTVDNPDATFKVAGFIQPNPVHPRQSWQAAWNATLLSADGEASLHRDRDRKLPGAAQFRVVFVIHDWKPGLPLRSSYGDPPRPPLQPLPERLWCLAPYELPD